MITKANQDLCMQHTNEDCGDFCPYCKVRALKAELTEAQQEIRNLHAAIEGDYDA